jgi:uncharacterized protein (TIGR02118 family)
MYKLLVLFKEPENKEEFDQFYYEEFLPMAAYIHGLDRLELTKVMPPIGIITTEPSLFTIQVEFYFDTKKSFQQFMEESSIGAEFQEKLSMYSDPIFTVAYGHTETIGRSEIVSRYNEYLIRSTSQ